MSGSQVSGSQVSKAPHLVPSYSGLSAALSLLKDQGQLQQRQAWAGRNTDKSRNALQVRCFWL